MRERRKIIRDLCPELVEQRSEFITVVGEHVACVSRHDCRAEALHDGQRVLRKRDRQFVARDAAAVIAVIKKARIPSDPRALESIGIQKLRVIAWQLMPEHFTPRRLQYSKEDRNIGHGTRHWTG